MYKKAIIFDRDGVINYDPHHLKKPSQIKILPYVFDNLKKLQKDYLLFIASNQSIVARKIISKKQLKEIDNKLKEILKKEKIIITRSYYCCHHPDFTGECNCRKPKAGLILKIINDFKIDVSKSWIIGDKISDIEAGRKAGIKNLVLVPTNLKIWDKEIDKYKFKYQKAENLKKVYKTINNFT